MSHVKRPVAKMRDIPTDAEFSNSASLICSSRLPAKPASTAVPAATAQEQKDDNDDEKSSDVHDMDPRRNAVTHLLRDRMHSNTS